MDDQLVKGDTVQLKSGGPLMTVAAKNTDNLFVCHWFHGTKLEMATFQSDELVKVWPSAPKSFIGSLV